MSRPTLKQCVVCGASDERALGEVGLAGGGRATLCGSHALMHARTGHAAASAAELRGWLGDRRVRQRRAEVDELAAALSAAFGAEARAGDRRGPGADPSGR